MPFSLHRTCCRHIRLSGNPGPAWTAALLPGWCQYLHFHSSRAAYTVVILPKRKSYQVTSVLKPFRSSPGCRNVPQRPTPPWPSPASRLTASSSNRPAAAYRSQLSNQATRSRTVLSLCSAFSFDPTATVTKSTFAGGVYSTTALHLPPPAPPVPAARPRGSPASAPGARSSGQLRRGPARFRHLRPRPRTASPRPRSPSTRGRARACSRPSAGGRCARKARHRLPQSAYDRKGPAPHDGRNGRRRLS